MIADPHRVAGPNALAPQLLVDAEPNQVALEPLGRLVNLEVRLGHDSLDATAAHPEGRVLTLDREPSP